jgi:hypothetical protein
LSRRTPKTVKRHPPVPARGSVIQSDSGIPFAIAPEIGMTLQEIDGALAAWNSRLAVAAQNLMDLQAEPTCEQLTGSGGAPKAPITGVTAARVEPALGAMLTAFQYFALLNDTIKHANALRHNLPTLFSSEQKLREIEEILCGKSIHLPAVDVPLEQRTLLSGVQCSESISPDELLDTMGKAFQAAKDAVLAVDAAWNSLGTALSQTGARIESLRQRAGALGCTSPAELDAAERALRELRIRVQNDPLGTSAGLDAEIQPVLARVESALEANERLRRQVANGLTVARGQMAALVELHRDSVAACGEARARITGCGTLLSPEAGEKVEALSEWLDRLEKKRAEGLWEPLTVGLRNWNSAAEDCVSRERAALAANRAPIEARNELRGRLDALQAKARAYGVAENNALVEAARQAEQLLYTRPTPLDRAAAAVAGYERVLNGGKPGSI